MISQLNNVVLGAKKQHGVTIRVSNKVFSWTWSVIVTPKKYIYVYEMLYYKYHKYHNLFAYSYNLLLIIY